MAATESSHNGQFRNYRPAYRPQQTEIFFGLYREDAEGQSRTKRKVRRTIKHPSTHPNQGRNVIFCLADEPIDYAFLIYLWSNEYGGNLICVDELFVTKPHRSRSIATQFLAIYLKRSLWRRHGHPTGSDPYSHPFRILSH